MNRILNVSGENIFWTVEADRIEELSDPKIGDSSRAFRIKTTVQGIPVTMFVIQFIKKDVHEEISDGGLSSDFESLKNIAKTAAAKIK